MQLRSTVHTSWFLLFLLAEVVVTTAMLTGGVQPINLRHTLYSSHGPVRFTFVHLPKSTNAFTAFP